jgi:hypothetical protein
MDPDTQLQVPSTPDPLLSSGIDRFPEERMKWLMSFRKIEKLILLKDPVDMIRMFQTLLKGQSVSYFVHHLRRRLEAEDSDLPNNVLIKLFITEMYIGSN